jgi:DNA mismatch repair protein MutS
MLQAGQNNFLAAICIQDGLAGLAILDSSTGEFAVTEMAAEAAQELLIQELARIKPSELLVGPHAEQFGEIATQALGSSVTEVKAVAADRAARMLTDKFQVANLKGFGCDDKPSALIAASMILGYAERNKLPLVHVSSLTTYSVDGFMRMDPATRRSLELTQNLSDGSKRFTLLSILDDTVTPMGARLVRRWIEQPLLEIEPIQKRLDAVARLHQHAMIRGELRDAMHKLADIERLVSRCATGIVNPRDLTGLRNTLVALPIVADPLRKVGLGRLQELRSQIGDHEILARNLDRALASEPPLTLRDGGIIRPGFDLELDKLRDLSKNGKAYIASLEQSERVKTGIGTLKVGFNSVFGYYLEVGKSHIDKVPENYIRKQTTANAERYITAELKDHESRVLGAEEKAVALEVDLFHRLRMQVVEESAPLLQTSRALAEVDVLASFAEVASGRRYVRPELVAEDLMEISAGRHAVVEVNRDNFVPNDLNIGPIDPGAKVQTDSLRTLILTGPNMAGKSTYLRQNALIAIMAQIGSFVPAASARLGLSDRIFARIGAKDELALGQSTFMVEMIESANILNHATERSFVILDEVGRGTSTYDGLAISWAMIEYLAGVATKTLFATHYHQLNALADQLPGIANFRVAVEELGDRIVWTHRVLAGGTDRSYGIHVAKMAGVPNQVLNRATEILEELESKGANPKASTPTTKPLQLTLFEIDEAPVLKELKGLDVNRLTPLEAIAINLRFPEG